MQVQANAWIPLDISDFPARHSYGLALCQRGFERILAGWVDELGVLITHEREAMGFAQDDTGVDVALSDGTSPRADYLVGCDGGRGVVRKAAGIEFAGWDPTTREKRGSRGEGSTPPASPRLAWRSAASPRCLPPPDGDPASRGSWGSDQG
jgi:2-polyprenyl-6-methoxyphenol hydroxylase-like FAD-dependent oxidoreductase